MNRRISSDGKELIDTQGRLYRLQDNVYQEIKTASRLQAILGSGWYLDEDDNAINIQGERLPFSFESIIKTIIYSNNRYYILLEAGQVHTTEHNDKNVIKLMALDINQLWLDNDWRIMMINRYNYLIIHSTSYSERNDRMIFRDGNFANTVTARSSHILYDDNVLLIVNYRVSLIDTTTTRYKLPIPVIDVTRYSQRSVILLGEDHKLYEFNLQSLKLTPVTENCSELEGREIVKLIAGSSNLESILIFQDSNDRFYNLTGTCELIEISVPSLFYKRQVPPKSARFKD